MYDKDRQSKFTIIVISLLIFPSFNNFPPSKNPMPVT